MHLERKSNFSKKKPTILVLAPTRELAMQTYETCTELSKFCTISSVCLYGGVPKDTQRKDLRNGAHVLVATPGRLKDLMEEGVCDLSEVTYAVLDEADRMLDFGFEKEVREILSKTNPNRQTVMFSATWPESIRKLASEFLKNPVKVTIGSDDLEANKNVSQFVEVLDDPFAKDRKLIQLLKKYHASRKNRVLVFVLYKKEAARVEGQLKRNGYNVRAIHGDMSQAQRIDSLNSFKDGSSPLLVATDVAARGLDIPNVEVVINYTFPLTIDEYIHRIGRTGRAGNKGISHTLFTQHDKAHAGSLVNVLKAANVDIPDSLLKFGTSVKKKEHGAYGAFYKDIDPSAKATKITFD
jgi:ATP-dependent RNA helicase DBP3